MFSLLFIFTICFVAAFLFAAVEWFEPDRRLVVIFKCAILAAGGAAIAKKVVALVKDMACSNFTQHQKDHWAASVASLLGAGGGLRGPLHK